MNIYLFLNFSLSPPPCGPHPPCPHCYLTGFTSLGLVRSLASVWKNEETQDRVGVLSLLNAPLGRAAAAMPCPLNWAGMWWCLVAASRVTLWVAVVDRLPAPHCGGRDCSASNRLVS
ncbi:hypothetical protein CgunFtcFv8_007774 [Champsocephalus gunnari]|uniref:Uncharacterized protein n=1 Tax=Champsocephalus gunnari TaxID=52237 RepID=A0AAN8CHW4_CHAGU|nr:hypothetical protein CgunFtcFv8_007774 [Champsocephalus gunnari]